ncbi:MAG: YceI family protein [Acidimicrobiales bacterium]|nr:YceI family protein [Acidimicrobiales bacterium]
MTTITSLTRTVDGVEVPAAGTYALDASHSHVGFSVRHLMVSKTKGRFADVTGTVVIAEDPLASSVEVSIATASIDTRDETRDGHLRSSDFLDVEHHPAITYRSRTVTPAGSGRWAVEGDLTVRGVTRPVALEVTFEGGAKDPWGGERIGFTARGELDREDFGLTWNQALETGGVLVGKAVKLEIEAEAVRQ